MRTASVRARALLLAALCAAVALPLHAATPAESAVGRADLERQLADAKARRDAAASEVARLNRELHGDSAPGQRAARGALIGVTLGDPDSGGEGVLIAAISPGGPAERAGLRAGDRLTAIDGQALRRSAERGAGRQLIEYLRSREPGVPVRIDYLRDGRAGSLTVDTAAAEPILGRVLREARRLPLPEGFELPDLEGLAGGLLAPARGLQLVALTPALGEYFGADRGLLVVRVPAEPGLPLREGDVLLNIAGREPEDAGHALRILRSFQPGEKVAVRVLRQRKTLDLELSVPAKPPV